MQCKFEKQYLLITETSLTASFLPISPKGWPGPDAILPGIMLTWLSSDRDTSSIFACALLGSGKICCKQKVRRIQYKLLLQITLSIFIILLKFFKIHIYPMCCALLQLFVCLGNTLGIFGHKYSQLSIQKFIFVIHQMLTVNQSPMCRA